MPEKSCPLSYSGDTMKMGQAFFWTYSTGGVTTELRITITWLHKGTGEVKSPCKCV